MQGWWGCDEPRGATGREGVKATMNFEQNQSGLVVWLKCTTDYNCSDHQGRGMKQKTATADYGIIPSATHSRPLRLCTFNQFLSKNRNKKESIKEPRQQLARLRPGVCLRRITMSPTQSTLKTLFYSIKIKLCLVGMQCLPTRQSSITRQHSKVFQQI